MSDDPKNPSDPYEEGVLPPSVYDAPETPEEDLWFLPGPPEDFAPGDSPFPFANRTHLVRPTAWAKAEQSHYKALIAAAEAVARFGARLHAMPPDVIERVALQTTSAVLRTEGVWAKPEHIALFRALRVSSQEETRDLERASWSVRRLIAMRHGGPLEDGLHVFLGRRAQHSSDAYEGADPVEDRLHGEDLNATGADWQGQLQQAGDIHPLTRAACGLFLWRRFEITPIDHALEPIVVAGLIGAGGTAPFLPMPDGMPHLHAHAADPSEAVLRFYQTTEQGALMSMLEMDRLVQWRSKARTAITDLSGRTPHSIVDTALRFPVFSAELAARFADCSAMSARRNLNLLQERGLLKEVTGQKRYRFWAALL